MTRYRCLVLDHDDTVADSTARIHYPAFLDALAQMRPGHSVTLEEYFLLNFRPGFLAYCEEVLGFTEAELEREYAIWQSWVRERVPKVYPGMAAIIRRQKAEGGLVCVSSHSVKANILRDYRENGLPEPDMVFGWELPREKRKPDIYAVREIEKQLGVRPEEMLMVDDLSTGLEMARAAGIDFAAACWAYDVPEIRAYMHAHAERCFDTPAELERFLFE